MAERSCELFPACKELGLTGLCCDTIEDVTLDCCTAEPIKQKCSENQACADRGLANFCCPAADGTFLDCCDEFANECKDSSRADCMVDPPPASCQASDACNALGLEGFCCPTVDGWMLDCCDGVAVEETCSENAACVELELTGACCPAQNGKYLDCCEALPNDCLESNSCEVISSRSYAQSVQLEPAPSAAMEHNNLLVFTLLVATLLVTALKK